MALDSTQSRTEMSTRNLPAGKGRPVRKADNLTAICKPIIQKMWDPRRLTILRASTTCYRGSCIFFFSGWKAGVHIRAVALGRFFSMSMGQTKPLPHENQGFLPRTQSSRNHSLTPSAENECRLNPTPSMWLPGVGLRHMCSVHSKRRRVLNSVLPTQSIIAVTRHPHTTCSFLVPLCIFLLLSVRDEIPFCVSKYLMVWTVYNSVTEYDHLLGTG
jgi:hypothetical protein